MKLSFNQVFFVALIVYLVYFAINAKELLAGFFERFFWSFLPGVDWLGHAAVFAAFSILIAIVLEKIGLLKLLEPKNREKKNYKIGFLQLGVSFAIAFLVWWFLILFLDIYHTPFVTNVVSTIWEPLYNIVQGIAFGGIVLMIIFLSDIIGNDANETILLAKGTKKLFQKIL